LRSIHRLITVVLSTAILSTVIFSTVTSTLTAGSHLWKVNEIFSNEDGTIQFIELHECCGASGEIYLTGIEVTSRATGAVFEFPDYLDLDTSHKFLLLGTEAFAALPGAPRPDYTIQNGFVGLDGDTIWYGESRNYDSFTYPKGVLPVDGHSSIQVTDFEDDLFTIGENSPTNLAEESGAVDVEDAVFNFYRGDCNDDRRRDISDAVFLLTSLFVAARTLNCEDACDTNDDGVIDIADAIAGLSFLFGGGTLSPPWQDCAPDPTADTLSCLSFSDCP
jgi:hypothetical protein